jgi:DNA-binding transcriptional ArsR family regulator|nr:winged helix-turn-helix domain-containing protein [uncultured Nitrososphaera sp.]
MFLTPGLLPDVIGLFIALRLPSFLRASPGGLAGQGSGGYIDPRFKRVLWYLIASSRGGVNRAKIIDMINGRPANANQIASELKLDYKTVLHHLKVLTENGMIVTENKETYGATYFLTPLMEKNYSSFQEILARIKKKA